MRDVVGKKRSGQNIYISSSEDTISLSRTSIKYCFVLSKRYDYNAIGLAGTQVQTDCTAVSSFSERHGRSEVKCEQ